MDKLDNFSVGTIKWKDTGREYEVCTEEEIDFYCNIVRNTYIAGLHVISNEDMLTAIKEYRIMKRDRGEFKEMSERQKQDFMKKEQDQTIAQMAFCKQR